MHPRCPLPHALPFTLSVPPAAADPGAGLRLARRRLLHHTCVRGLAQPHSSIFAYMVVAAVIFAATYR